MTFGGLCAAYIVTATNKAIEWRPFDLPIQVWISTIIILVSSAVYHRAKVALDDGNQPVARRWLIATAALGAAFISSQLLAWLELSQRGLYFRGNPYAGFFYILTAVHALHVLGGVIALGSIVLHSWNPIASHEMWQRVRSLAQTVGWYWHFMGGVWLVLFVLLGFWK
jgi:cytochrome c oxidase subunit 3